MAISKGTALVRKTKGAAHERLSQTRKLVGRDHPDRSRRDRARGELQSRVAGTSGPSVEALACYSSLHRRQHPDGTATALSRSAFAGHGREALNAPHKFHSVACVHRRALSALI